MPDALTEAWSFWTGGDVVRKVRDWATQPESTPVAGRDVPQYGAVGGPTSIEPAVPLSTFSPTTPSANAAAKKNDPLQVHARLAVIEAYNLRPQGSESEESLLYRISGVYYDHRASTWAGQPSVDNVLADPFLHRVVALVSPMSSQKSAAAVVQKEQQIVPRDYTEPRAGSRPVVFDSLEEALKVVSKGLEAYSDYEKRRLAEELLKRQQQGQQNFIPGKQADEDLKNKVTPWFLQPGVIALAIGGVLVGGIALAFVAGRPGK